MRQKSEISNAQIATLATYLLGGENSAIDLEDVAIKSFEIAPSKFCWKRYPERIDIHVVRVALSDACRISKPWVSGSIRKGYMVTSEGLSMLDKLEQDKLISFGDTYRRASSEAERELEIERLMNSSAFRKYEEGKFEHITRREFQDFTRVNDYFQEHQKEKRFTRLENQVRDHEELSLLWDLLKTKFS